MAINIDDVSGIKALDSRDMAASIAKFPDQIEQIYADVKKLKIPTSYKKIKNIVLFGMGGSALGAHCVKTIFEKELKVPFEIVNNYYNIGSVNKNTLCLVISYSGTTEEAISALKVIQKNKPKILVVTSGGELLNVARKTKTPALVFGTQNNPCGSPRMGLGYTFFGPMFVLEKLGLINLKSTNLKLLTSTARKYYDRFKASNPEALNLSKQLSEAMVRGAVWYVASEHLAGCAHTAANQMNENGKRFASFFTIPELNHHLLEGLKFPAIDQNTFFFIESKFYDARTQKRYLITKEILTGQGKQFLTYSCEEQKPLLQAIEVLILGSFLSYYSAMLEGIDPTAIPTVDFLKAALKK